MKIKKIAVGVIFLICIVSLIGIWAKTKAWSSSDQPVSFSLFTNEPEFYRPYYVATDTTGDIYIYDADKLITKVYSSAGVYERTISDLTIPGGSFKPSIVKFDSSNNMFAVDINGSFRRIIKYDSSGTYIATIGSNGGGDGQFSAIDDITLDASGNLYVVDSSLNRVQKFSNGGSYLSKFGTYGTTDGFLNNPRGVAVDSAGNIYVTNSTTRVQKFDSSGVYQYKLPTSFTYPYQVAVDSTDRVYVVENANGSTPGVKVYNSAGVFQTQWGANGDAQAGVAGLERPYDIYVDPANGIFVSDVENLQVKKYDTSGNLTMTVGSILQDKVVFRPGGIAKDAAGNIYIADTGNYRVQKISPNGTLLLKFGSYGTGNGQFTALRCLTVAPNGDIYVGDLNRIQKFDANGNYLLQWGGFGTTDGLFQNVTGLAVASNGNVYAGDVNASHRIQVFNSSGVFQFKFGSSGGGNGQFLSLGGIDIDANDNVYAVDPIGTPRLQIFNSSGTYQSGFTLGFIPGASSVDVTTGNELFIAGSHKVGRYTTQGTPLAYYGGSTIGRAVNEFYYTSGIVAGSDGYIYVVDTQNQAIKKLTFDVTGPAIDFAELTNDETTQRTFTINATVTDDLTNITQAFCQVDSSSGTWTSKNAVDGTVNELQEEFSCQLTNLSYGQHTLYMKALDSKNTETVASYTFTVLDEINPRITLTTPLAGYLTEASVSATGYGYDLVTGAFAETSSQTGNYTGLGTNMNWNTDNGVWQYSFLDDFKFNFWGQNYSSFYVSSNGRLCFGSGSTSATGSLTDTSCGPFIAPLWMDLGKSAITDKIKISQTSDSVRVGWKDEFTNLIPPSGTQSTGIAQGWNGDDSAWLYTLPFSFSFYGNTYTQIKVGSNGNICFDISKNCTWYEEVLSTANNPVINVMGEDLMTNYSRSGSDIYITEEADKVYIKWIAVDYGNKNPVDVELVLFADGTIRFNYGRQDNLPFAVEATVGVSSGDGTHYTLSAYNERTTFNFLTSKLFTLSGSNYVESDVQGGAEELVTFKVEAVLHADGRIEFDYGDDYDFSRIYNIAMPIIGVSKGDGSSYFLSPSSGNKLDTSTNDTRIIKEVSGSAITGVSYVLDSGSPSACSAADSAFNSYSEQFICPLTLTEGDHDASFTVTDASANQATISRSFTVDSISPIGNVTINSGALTTTSRDVALTIAASDAGSGVVSMLISENSLMTGATWVPYEASKVLTLSAGNSVKNVYVQLMDTAGNTSATYQDSITLKDPVPAYIIRNPLSPSYSTNGNSKTIIPTITPTVTVTPTPFPTDEPKVDLLIELFDVNGNLLRNTEVVIDGKTYISNADGVLVLDSAIVTEKDIIIKIGNEQYTGNLSGKKLTVEMVPNKKRSKLIPVTLSLLAVGVVAYVVWKAHPKRGK